LGKLKIVADTNIFVSSVFWSGNPCNIIRKAINQEIIALFAHFISPKEKVSFIKEDEKDNIILECAVSANADYIVSGDYHILNLKEYKGIKIATAAKLLEILKM